MEIPHDISTYFGPAVASVGGAASYLHKWLQGEKFVLAKFIATAFIGGFVGTLAGLFAQTVFPAGSPLITFIIGASGAIGYDAIRPLWDRVIAHSDTV